MIEKLGNNDVIYYKSKKYIGNKNLLAQLEKEERIKKELKNI